MADGIKIINNEQRQHFETKLDNGEFAFIEYRWHKEILVIMHTFVPEAYEGKGIASSMAAFALTYARSNRLKVLVYCPYVKGYLARHPEYNDLLAASPM